MEWKTKGRQVKYLKESGTQAHKEKHYFALA